ncbi:MAG: MFS transporter [Thermoleophilaceae bacterium]
MTSRQRWTLIAVCLGTFMLLLDITVVNVALPDIRSSLHASFSDLQWVVDAYSLSLATLLLTAGSLADALGRRRVFVAGMGIFVLASLLCGLSGTPTMLNLSRALQGLGGAVMFACSLALLGVEFQGRERGAAFGAWGGTIGFAVAVGPLVGGALTDGFGWEWIFFVNVPVGIATMALATLKVPDSRNPNAKGIDWFGMVFFSASLFLLVFGLIKANDLGWGSTTIVLRFVGAAVLFAAFIFAEQRVKNPMFDLSLFRKPAFDGISIAAFTLSASMFAMFLYLTLYLQNVLAYSPLQAGLRFLPFSVMSFVLAPIAGNLAQRYPVRGFLGIGLVMVSGGLLLMHGVTPHSSWTTLLAGLIIAGAGVGLINPALATGAVGVVRPEQSGVASGINNTFRQVGIATGIAALGAIFQAQIQSKIGTALAGTPAAGRVHDIARGIAGGGAQQIKQSVPPQFSGRFTAAANTAFCSAFNDILIIGSVLAVCGAVLAFALTRERDFVSHGAAAEAAHA